MIKHPKILRKCHQHARTLPLELKPDNGNRLEGRVKMLNDPFEVVKLISARQPQGAKLSGTRNGEYLFKINLSYVRTCRGQFPCFDKSVTHGASLIFVLASERPADKGQRRPL